MKHSSRNPDAHGQPRGKRPTPQRQPNVLREEAGRFLVDWLRHRLSLPRDAALQMVRRGLVRVAGKPCNNPQQRVQHGQTIDIRVPKKDVRPVRPTAPKAKPSKAAKAVRPVPVDVLYVDEHLVVALSGLGHRRVQSRHALRQIRGPATGRG